MNTSPDAPHPAPEPQHIGTVPAIAPSTPSADSATRVDTHMPDPAEPVETSLGPEVDEECEVDAEENENDEGADADTSELADWKDALREDFEVWLATLDEIPDAGDPAGDDANDAPDLYSFYEQFAAAGAESRKANRRTAEAMSQWGDTLARFESGLQPLRETAAQLAAAQPKSGRMTRAHCLVLVELLDRMYRLDRAFETPPAAPAAKRSWFGLAPGTAVTAATDEAWRAAWTAQRQALAILVSHLEGWLAKEGITRQIATGQPFDPVFMMAVATEPDSTRPPQTVLEELAAGYLRDGELLRAAQVKVSRRP